MGKIKLNLVSGSVVEKPLLNAFNGNGNSYVVLDNEMNGSMGLPIILVCKLAGDKLTKIVDNNEWQSVKELLKSIIAGGQIEFIPVNSELAADDIYYTQLTLPVSSFDALKNAYKMDDTPAPAVEQPVLETPQVEMPTPEPVSASPVDVPPMEPVMPTPEPAGIPSVEPVVNTPQVEPVPGITPEPMPTINPEPVPVVNPEPTPNDVPNPFGMPLSSEPEVAPVPPKMEPEITPTPIIDTGISSAPQEDIFKEQKEAFMQACENMFDALVQRFERELENRS